MNTNEATTATDTDENNPNASIPAPRIPVRWKVTAASRDIAEHMKCDRNATTAERKAAKEFRYEVMAALDRMRLGDYGNVSEDDAAMNRADAVLGEGTCIGRYPSMHGDIWVIVTLEVGTAAVLFPYEY